MANQKITFGDFLKKLKDGEYSKSTGAKRAISRASKNGWTEEDVKKARRAACRKFEVSMDYMEGGSVNAPKKGAKKTTKKTAPKKDSPLARQQARNAKSFKKTASNIVTREVNPSELWELNPLAAVGLTTQIVGTARQAIDSFQLAASVHPPLANSKEYKSGLSAANRVISLSIQALDHHIVTPMAAGIKLAPVDNGASTEKVTEPKATITPDGVILERYPLPVG